MPHSRSRRLPPALLLAAALLLFTYGCAKPGPASKPPAAEAPASSAEPTPAPLPEPAPEATPEATAALPKELPEAWFDEALFIGDSITGSLSSYALLNGGLGNATFLHVNGLGCHHIIRDERTIPILGTSLPIEDAVAASGCGKLFLMLAMNDIGTEPLEQLQTDWETMLDRILEKNPGLEIYVQSGTPILQDSSYFTRENMEAYNAMLLEVCQSRGCVYVDVTRDLVDETGFLKSELHNDNVHMNPGGCAIWVENLRDPDSYTPPLVWEQEGTP